MTPSFRSVMAVRVLQVTVHTIAAEFVTGRHEIVNTMGEELK